MSCRITYTQDQKISRVEMSNGQESVLFNSVRNHPMIATQDLALEVYKNIYSYDIAQDSENILSVERGLLFVHRVQGEIIGSYRDALNKESQEIELGFLSNNGVFYPVLKIQPTFDTKTQTGFINSAIKEGIMSDKKITRNGDVFLQPAGTSQVARGVYDILLREQMYLNFGSAGYVRTRNGFQIVEPKDTKYTDQVDNILQEEIRNILKAKAERRNQEEPETKQLNEDDLKLRLLDTLNNMGVSVVSISEYVKKYKIKHGVEPSAEALADIANKVVAFKDGKITIEALTEEVAHFIVEGWNQEQIENLLRNIHRTEEWAEFSEAYREVYSKEYPQDQVDNVVRREVLGKVLANSLRSGFQTETKTDTQQSIIQRLQDLFTQFIEAVRSLFNQTYQNELNQFTDQVQDLLYEQRLSDFVDTQQLEQSSLRLYSMSKAGKELKQERLQTMQALKAVRNTLNELIKNNSAFSAQKARLDRTLKQLTEQELDLVQKQSVIELLNIADSVANHLKPKLSKEAQDQYPLTAAEENAFYNLQQSIKPLLSQIADNLTKNTEYGREWSDVIASINEVNTKIQALDGAKSNLTNRVIDRLTESIMIRHNLGEEYREYVQAWLKDVESDTSHFHRFFGQIVNSKDPLLGLASATIEKTANQANREYIEAARKFMEKLRELGIDPPQLQQLADKGHIVSFFDETLKEQTLERQRAKIRLQVTGQQVTEDAIKQTIEAANKNQLPELTLDQTREYQRKYNAVKMALQESYFTKEYYEQEEAKYKEYDIAPETIALRKKYSHDRSQAIQEATRELPNGEKVIDYSQLSVESEERFAANMRDRANDKDVFDENGNLKNGINFVHLSDIALTQEDVARINELEEQLKTATKEKANNIKFEINEVYSKRVAAQGHTQPVVLKGMVYFLDKDTSRDFSTEASRIALDLIKLDQVYVADADGTKTPDSVPDTFIEELRKIEQTQGSEAAYRFLTLNASLNFTEDFWSEFSEKGSFLEEFRNSEFAEDFQGELREIQELNNKRSQLLKKFRKLNKPHETDVSKMKLSTKKEILKIDGELQSLYRILSAAYQTERQITDEEADPNHITEVNEAYLETVKEKNLTAEQEIEFIKESTNSLPSAAERIFSFKRSLRRYLDGKADTIPPSHLRFLENYTGDLLNETDVTRNYARTQVASFYKRLVPKEYSEIFDHTQPDDIRYDEQGNPVITPTISATEYLQRLINAEHVDVRPNYSWFQAEDTQFRNPNFDPNYGGLSQPKRGDITLPDGEVVNLESKKYKELFAPDANGNPTRNQKMFEARNALLELHETSLQNYGIENAHNLYLKPQIYKKGVDRIKDFLQNVSIKKGVQNFKELATYREDDVEYGEKVLNTKIIPMYYVRKLENQDEVTDELFFSYMAMAQQSFLYKSRKQNFGDMMAIQDAILNRKGIKGKAAEATVTMDMFQNYLDYSIYGIKESQELKFTVLGKEIDMTKIARGFLNFVGLRNLGFSFSIPATSYTTQEIQYQIDQRVGEIVQADSATMATKEYSKLAFDAMKEMGKFFSTSKLNKLGEFFGMYNLNDRFKNSNYGYVLRNIGDVGMMNHQIANFPVSPRIMLSILYDNRLVNGVIINFNQFKKSQNKDLTNSQIKAEWAKYKKDAIYNYIEVTDTGVKFTDGLKNKLNLDGLNITPEMYLEEKMEGLTTNIKRAVSQFDTQITNTQRIAAQRNFLLNFFMTHTQWLSIGIQNRFKSLHRNTMTGMLEEGSYTSLYNFAGDLARAFMNKQGIKSFMNVWNGVGLQLPADQKAYLKELQDKLNRESDPELRRQIQEQIDNISPVKGVRLSDLLETRRRNLRRVVIDTAALSALAAVSYLLMNLADDDEDNIALQTANYIMLRTMNEVVSGQTGVVTQLYEKGDSPIVSLGMIGDMLRLPVDFVNNDEIQSGFYKGHTVRYRALSRVLPGLRTINEFNNMKGTADNYWFYNNKNISFSLPGAVYVSALTND